MNKTCLRCGITDEVSKFRKDRNICKKCWNKEQRENYKKRMTNPQKHLNHKERQRRYHLRVKYGLTLEQADTLYSRGCEVCGSEKNLSIDHDHETGKIRGCLCSNCNRGLGYLKDDVSRLQAVIEYLKINTTE